MAAIMVMLCHCGPPIEPIVAHGHLAVDLFFMLSGFVLAHVYEERFAAGMTARSYISRRLGRLYPLLFVGSLIGFTAYAFGFSQLAVREPTDLALAVVGQFFLVPFLASTTQAFALNPPQWSIVYELIANVAHARGFRWLSVRRLIAVVAGSGLVTASLAIEYHNLDFGWRADQSLPGLARATFGFFCGVLIWRLRDRFPRSSPRHALAVTGCLTILAALDPLSVGVSSTNSAVYELSLVFIVLPAILVIASRGEGGAAARALGVLSFPLYVIHRPVLDALVEYGAGVAAQLSACAGLVGVAWAIGKWLDEPFMAWRRRRRDERPLPQYAAAF